MGFVISMKFFSKFRTLAMLAVALMAIGTRAAAQQGIGVSITSSTNFIAVSNSLTYTINLTNLTAGTFVVFVTNTFPAAAQLLGASIIPGPAPTVTNANGFSFNNIPLDTVTPIQNMTVTAEPTQVGLFTNTVVVAIFGVTNITANMVTQVTNAPALPQADLAVAMTGPTSQVFSNDWMVYGVSVTNLGPATAPSVFLTNMLPTGVGYKSVSPVLTRLGSGSNVIFNLGTLASGAFTNLHLTVQPTNAGTLPFVSVVSTNGVFDPIPANNLASNNIVVSNFLSHPGQLTATIIPTQKFNQLSGRLEQSIVLSNAGPTSVDSARVTVTGLTNWLSNAMGTNNGNPFVTYASALTNGQGGAYLLLQFYPNQNPFPFTNSQLRADGVTLPNLAPAASGLMPTNILLMARLPSGGVFLEFPTLTNRAFTVEYSSNLVNWLAAQPITVTPANYTAWIDYGPPETVSHPTNTPTRFYRVFLNP